MKSKTPKPKKQMFNFIKHILGFHRWVKIETDGDDGYEYQRCLICSRFRRI